MSARISLFFALFVTGMGHAGLSAEAGAQKFAPETYGINRYQQIWKRSPFIVETVTVVQSAGLATKYGLVGIASLDNYPVVFLLDRNEDPAKNNRFMVSKAKPDAVHNIELLSVSMDRDTRKSKATIKQGAEQADILFDPAILPPTGPVAGAAGAAPMPVMPTSQQIPPGYEQPGPGVPPPPQGLGAAPGGNGNIIRLGGASGQVNPSMPAPQPNMVNPNGQIPPTPTRRIIRPKPINVN